MVKQEWLPADLGYSNLINNLKNTNPHLQQLHSIRSLPHSFQSVASGSAQQEWSFIPFRYDTIIS